MKSLRQMPFFRLVFPFILGILLSIYFDWDSKIIVWNIPLILIFLVLIFCKKGLFEIRWLFGFLATILILIIGYFRGNQHQELNANNHFNQYLSESEITMQGEIYEMPKVTDKRIKIKISVDKIALNNSKFHQSSGNILAYVHRDSLSEKLAYGDKIICHGMVNELDLPKNPHAFNFKNYLHFQNINYQVFLKENEWKLSDKSGGNTILKFAFIQRKKFINILRRYLPEEQSFSVGSALILGYKDEINEEVRTAYAQTGAMHILAVSGLHVGLIYLIIRWIFDKIIRIRSKKIQVFRGFLCLIGVWIFALLTGMSPSVMRASTMFSIIIIGNMLSRNANIYNSLAASAFILLMWNPLYIMSVGFQLSYLAVTGIVYFQPKIYRLHICENKISDFIWQLVTVSISAQFLTLPLSLYYFHQFPVYFWLSGLIVVPAAGIILSNGLLIFVLESINIGLGLWIGVFLNWLIWIVNSLIFLLQKLPGSVIDGVWLSSFLALVLYLAIAFFVKGINTRHGKNLVFSLGILALVFIFSAFQKSLLINNQQVIVYDIYRNTLIECVNKRTSFSFKNKGLKNKSYKFSTQNNHYAHNVNKVEVFNIDALNHENLSLIAQQNFLRFKNKTFFLLSEMPSQKPKNTKLDYLLVYGNPRLDFEKLTKLFSFNEIIFDSSNSQYKVRKWIEYCENNDIKYHYTAEDGAWILDL